MLGTFAWVGDKHDEAYYQFPFDGQIVSAHITSFPPSSTIGPAIKLFGASAAFKLHDKDQVIRASGNTPEDAVMSAQEEIDQWLESVARTSPK